MALFVFVVVFKLATSLPQLQTEYSSSRWKTWGADKGKRKEPSAITWPVRELSAPLLVFLPSFWSVPSSGVESHWLFFSAPLVLFLPNVKSLDEEVASSIGTHIPRELNLNPGDWK